MLILLSKLITDFSAFIIITAALKTCHSTATIRSILPSSIETVYPYNDSFNAFVLINFRLIEAQCQQWQLPAQHLLCIHMALLHLRYEVCFLIIYSQYHRLYKLYSRWSPFLPSVILILITFWFKNSFCISLSYFTLSIRFQTSIFSPQRGSVPNRVTWVLGNQAFADCSIQFSS